MSHPPTEAGQLASNNSLFSDSVDFDRAEKPITEHEANHLADDFNDPNYIIDGESAGQPRGVTHLYPEENNEEYNNPGYDDAPAPEFDIPEEDAPFLKTRHHKVRGPEAWAPIDALDVAGGDPDDEFALATALRPISAEKPSAGKQGRKSMAFTNGEPDMEGDEEIANCFDEPGLLYRIINKRNRTWSFYNDSLAFEIHAMCTFGPQSKIEPLGNTTNHVNDKKEYVAEVVVYPGETEMFIKGFVNGFTSKLRALPLSDEYYASRSEKQYEGVIEKEMAAVREIIGDVSPDNTEAVLQACIETNTPFVDLSFPPTQDSIEKSSVKKFKTLPWARPRQYLRDRIYPLKAAAAAEGQPEEDFDDQVRLFRRAVTPGIVDGGELGDCWLQCAIATLSENESAIVNAFRHPKGAEFAKAERKVGAYRVTFNKSGLWRSVVVDDYFPVVSTKLKFAHIKSLGVGDEDFEIWPAVLQKAYAKMHGSYAAIMSGDPVHALTDLTGAPSYRFDEQFSEARVNGGEELFTKLQEMIYGGAVPGSGSSSSGTPRRESASGIDNDSAYQVIFTTPGKAPAIIPGGGETQYDFSEEPEMAKALRGTDLLPGHAYTVLQVKNYRREGIRMIQVRNPWPHTLNADGGAIAEEDVVAWGANSPLWATHTNVARDCGMSGPSNAYNEKERGSTRWFAWQDALKYFAGGGVVFQNLTKNVAHDIRIPITFSDCRPSLVFELSVDAPTDVVTMLSNMDHRGAGMPAAEDPESSTDYPPVMLSLAVQNEKHMNLQNGTANTRTGHATDDVFRIVMNTSADVAMPSDSKWTFLQAREIAMRVTLTPEDGPYYLIPRLMEGEDTVGAGSNAGEFDGIDPVHMANNYARVFPMEAEACEGRKEIPVSIGIIGGLTDGAVGVHIKKISGSNSVFENFPKFPTDGDVVDNDAEVYFQMKEPTVGFAVEKVGTTTY